MSRHGLQPMVRGWMVQRAYSFSEGGPVSELAIVDTFTKLIFGEEDYSFREQLIIQAFRLADSNFLLHSHQDMGEYLRGLGVQEMIDLVSRMQTLMIGGMPALASGMGDAPSSEHAGDHAMNRRTH